MAIKIHIELHQRPWRVVNVMKVRRSAFPSTTHSFGALASFEDMPTQLDSRGCLLARFSKQREGRRRYIHSFRGQEARAWRPVLSTPLATVYNFQSSP
jgi:hypothetical protein